MDNIDISKTIERFHPGQHQVTDDHTGVLSRDGTATAQPGTGAAGPKVGGKVLDLISDEWSADCDSIIGAV